MLTIADRVQEFTNAAGSGNILLQGAVPGFRTFSTAVSSTSQVPYVISKGAIYEVGIGTVTSGSPWILTRNTVEMSSNSNQLINVEAGMFVFIDITTSFVNSVIGDISSTLDTINGVVI